MTNATWDDFWLNEGFTVYFERRIMESIKVKNTPRCYSPWIPRSSAIEAMGKNRDTHLKLNLDGKSDDGFEYCV